MFSKSALVLAALVTIANSVTASAATPVSKYVSAAPQVVTLPPAPESNVVAALKKKKKKTTLSVVIYSGSCPAGAAQGVPDNCGWTGQVTDENGKTTCSYECN